MRKQSRQAWLNTPASDLVFILSPPFLSLLIVFLFPEPFQQASGIPLAYWVLLILFIDVAHVYSTLYRTYFKRNILRMKTALLTGVPIGCYITGIILYSTDSLLFWRVLAYLAVYHFIRQQYGFMRLYSRSEHAPPYCRWIDTIAIYTATIYPLIFWHLNGDRNFTWFVEDDFFRFEHSSRLSGYFTLAYLTVIVVYLIKELSLIIQSRQFNIPRNLLIAGTFLSWYFGIVYFNGDMAFTTLNVISHGIPYMALIWFFEKKRLNQAPDKSQLTKLISGRSGILYFLLLLIVLAYFEEGLWDGLVWQEHQNFFAPFAFLPVISEEYLLALLVPLLALPQATHYVLDGFIWRKNSGF